MITQLVTQDLEFTTWMDDHLCSLWSLIVSTFRKIYLLNWSCAWVGIWNSDFDVFVTQITNEYWYEPISVGTIDEPTLGSKYGSSWAAHRAGGECSFFILLTTPPCQYTDTAVYTTYGWELFCCQNTTNIPGDTIQCLQCTCSLHCGKLHMHRPDQQASHYCLWHRVPCSTSASSCAKHGHQRRRMRLLPWQWVLQSPSYA